MRIPPNGARTGEGQKGERRDARLRSLWRLLVFGLLLTLTSCSLFAQAGELYSMEPVKAKESRKLPPSVLNAVRPQGFRVLTRSDAGKSALCEIFWTRGVAAGGALSGSKSPYSGVTPGTFLGVIRFLVNEHYVREFRSQKFKPGYYTMRYAALPEGANGGEQDFVLLSPLASDRTPAQIVPIEELMRRGRLASHSNRPSMMSLTEADNDESFPGLITDEEGTSVLQVKLRWNAKRNGPANDLPVALVVVTVIPEDRGD